MGPPLDNQQTEAASLSLLAGGGEGRIVGRNMRIREESNLHPRHEDETHPWTAADQRGRVRHHREEEEARRGAHPEQINHQTKTNGGYRLKGQHIVNPSLTKQKFWKYCCWYDFGVGEGDSAETHRNYRHIYSAPKGFEVCARTIWYWKQEHKLWVMRG